MDWSDGSFQICTVAGRSRAHHFRRFLTSPHTRDLLLICIIAFGVAALFLVEGVSNKWKPEVSGVMITAMLGVISWAYQSANIRFGAADLFASEITALCRVGAVGEFMDHLAQQYCLGLPLAAPARDTSEYFTAYNNNAKDIEVLDGDVVDAVAQFYANMKVFRDVLRQPLHDHGSVGTKERQLAAIYYGFLAFESARMALAVLIDDVSRSREAILTAMTSELPAYVLLHSEFCKRQDDLRWAMIERRFAAYGKLIEEIKKSRPTLDHRAEVLAEQVLTFWETHVNGSQFKLPERWRLVNPAHQTPQAA